MNILEAKRTERICKHTISSFLKTVYNMCFICIDNFVFNSLLFKMNYMCPFRPQLLYTHK